MALNPKDLYSEGWWDEKTPSLPPGVTAPPGVDWASGKYYAHYRINRDGTREIQWYQRGTGGGPDGKGDKVMAETNDQLPAASDVVKAWEEAQAKEEKPAAAPTTRVINGVPHQYDPATNSWVPAQTTAGPAQPTTGATAIPADAVPRTEGTPLPDGTFNNNAPVRVWRRPDGTVVKTEPLTPAERAQWEREKNGGKTDAELAEKPAPDTIGKPTGNTRQKEEGGKVVKETEYVLPDGTKEWRTQEAPAPQSSARQPQLAPDKKSWGYFDTTDPQNPRWVTIPPDKAPPLPGEPDKPPTNVEGVYGTWKQQDGAWTFVPVAEQPGGIKLPSGAPPMDTSSPQAAFDSFQRLTAWVHQQVAEGKLKPGDVRSVLEAPHAQVSMILDREKSQRADALSQRGQDVSIQTNALSNATSGYTSTLGQAMNLAKGVDPGHNHTMNFLLGGLALQQAQAANLGWNPQGIAPVMANPMGGGVVPGPVASGVRPYAPGVTPVPQNTGAPVPAPAILQGSSLDPNAAAVPAPTGVGLPPPLLPPRPPVDLPPPPAPEPQAELDQSGLPIMALNRSMGIGQGYDPAIASLKRLGLDDATIQLAMQQHLMGV